MRAESLSLVMMRTPLYRYLGATMTSADDRCVEAKLPFSERLVGNPALKLFHGGIVSTFLETVATFAVWHDLSKQAPKPINLTVDYMRPALSETLHASASTTQLGNRVSRVEAICWQADRDKLVAKGLFHFLMI